MKFTELLCQWRLKRSKELTARTWEQYRSMYERWRRHFAEKELREITPAKIEDYRLLRDDGKRGGDILNKERAELMAFFEYSVLLEWLPANPVKTWPRKKVEVSREYVVLDRSEEDALVRWIRQDLSQVVNMGHLKTLPNYVRFSIATGLRQGTIRQLKRSMVDIKRRTLSIPGPCMKSKKPLVIPLSQKAWDAINLHSYDGSLFPGLPSQQKIHRLVRAAAERAGLSPHLSPHDFRRTWVARMRDAGADIADVMRLGGWTHPTALLKHYYGEVPHERALELLNAI
jgi:integrase